jgi:hypothetical protein
MFSAKIYYFGLIFVVSFVVGAESKDHKQEKQRKAVIHSCRSISDVSQRKLCFEEKKRRVARRRALNDILAIGPDGGSTQGGWCQRLRSDC